ncbi:MAG: site-specific DNA-methyltransferase, partial [Clostridia bacterium]|nr:site-specific DNA-methyltransferase [Clostridia bacterium]
GVPKNAKWVFNKPADVPYLRSTYETGVVAGSERTDHPTQKSLKLMEHIIKIHTDENAVVLDPFMGSGTTGVACLKNSRKFIGVEVSPDYFDTAEKRIADAAKQ